MLWFVVAALLAVAAGPEVAVETLAGQVHTGTLIAWNGGIELASPRGSVKLPLAEVLAVAPRATREAPPAALVELVDGTRLPVASVRVDDQRVLCGLGEPAPLEVPLAQVRSIRFAALDSPLEQAWQEVAGIDAAADLLVIRKEQALDYLEGAVGPIDDLQVAFTLDGEPLEVKRGKVYGVIFYRPTAPRLAEPVATITAADGLRAAAARVACRDGLLSIATTGGLEFTRPLARVGRLDFSRGKLAYLSDLEPDELDWQWAFQAPAVVREAAAQFTRPRRDQSFDGGPLRLGGRAYEKGLAARTKTRWEFHLGGKYRKLTAVAGIDDRAGDQGHVRLTIRGDQAELFAGEMSGRDRPLPLELDLAGVRRLVIDVDFGSDASVNDFFNLCAARVLE